MYPKDLEPIYKLTAQATNLPLKTVKHIIKEGEFRFIRNWAKSPDLSAIQLSELGTFQLNLKVITAEIYRHIRMMRGGDKSPPTVARFRELWKLRKQTINYLNKKKRKKKHETSRSKSIDSTTDAT